MKKLLNILAVVTMVGPPTAAIVGCGNNRVITYAYIDNGSDKNSRGMFEEVERQFYELYGNRYTLRGVKWAEESSEVENILTVGSGSAPDVFTANADQVSRLATANAILALEGADSPKGADTILERLNYNQESAQLVLNRLIAGEELDVTTLWKTWMPNAIRFSKILSNNASSREENPVQYGITKHLGVGGGSALISTDEKSQAFFESVGMSNGKNADDGGLKWTDSVDDATFSINQWINYSANSTNTDNNANAFIPFMIDRGMWWMYPVYANIISDPINVDGEEVRFKAADIGMNWLNEESLPYYEPNDGTYSSLWSNRYFQESIKEVLGKWFEAFSQQYKVAITNLGIDGGGQASTRPENLLHPTNNAAVQAHMINNQFSGGVNYEPGSYFDMLPGMGLFSNMDFASLTNFNLFDREEEKELAEKYGDLGANRWMAPAGSGMFVFNTQLGRSSERLRYAQKFVQLYFGAKEDNEGVVTWDENGGQANFSGQFANTGDNPAKLAILSEELKNTPEFDAAIASKVQVRYDRAMNESAAFAAQMTTPAAIAREKAALTRLEKTSISLAASLYVDERPGISYAPNVSAYDTATMNDWHGNNAMLPALRGALADDINTESDFEAIYGLLNSSSIDWISQEAFINARDTFIENLVASLAELNRQQSNLN